MIMLFSEHIIVNVCNVEVHGRTMTEMVSTAALHLEGKTQ